MEMMHEKEEPLLSKLLNSDHKAIATYYLSYVRGKGEGIIANKDIPYGSLIFVEKPIIYCRKISKLSIYENMREQFYHLPPFEQILFLSLHDASSKDESKTLEGIFDTNKLSLCDCEVAICLMISKFNHSCKASVAHAYAAPFIRVYATRNIQKGEELCISYGGKFQTLRKRMQYLQNNWKFQCNCSLCELNELQRLKYESSIKMYRLLELNLSKCCSFSKMDKLLRRMLKVCIDYEIMDPAMKYQHEYSMFLCQENLGNVKIAHQHATRAKDAAKIIWGYGYWLVSHYENYLQGKIDIQEFKKLYSEKFCCKALRIR